MDNNQLQQETQIYKESPEKLYTRRFFMKLQRVRPWQVIIGENIANTYKINSVVDFGCGLGFYLEGMLKGGATNIKGFEYLFPIAKEFIPKEIISYIEYGNLMEKINCGIFDCAMSIEVAEHLLPEKSDVFLDNLTNASVKYIVFSAAQPGQGGTGHINEQPHKYWIDKLETKGFMYSQDDTLAVRDFFNKLPFHTKYISVMKRQMLFFKRRAQ